MFLLVYRTVYVRKHGIRMQQIHFVCSLVEAFPGWDEVLFWHDTMHNLNSPRHRWRVPVVALRSRLVRGRSHDCEAQRSLFSLSAFYEGTRRLIELPNFHGPQLSHIAGTSGFFRNLQRCTYETCVVILWARDATLQSRCGFKRGSGDCRNVLVANCFLDKGSGPRRLLCQRTRDLCIPAKQ